MIDSIIVKVLQHSASAKKGDNYQAIGRSREGLTSKLHVVVDEKSRPLKLLLSGGNRNDICMAPLLLEGLELYSCYVVADKGYDSAGFVGWIRTGLGSAVIPSRRTNKVQREYEKEQYKSRNQEERFFNRMKQYRRGMRRQPNHYFLLLFISLLYSFTWLFLVFTEAP